jgi:large repetitive protein
MNGLRNRVRGLRSLSTAAMALALAGGALTITAVTAVTNAAPAAAMSASPAWFTTLGVSAPTLSCGTWYVTTMSAQAGGGNANITIIGGGGGGGGSSLDGIGNEANTGAGGGGGTVAGTFSVPAGETIAAMIGCGGGGGSENTSAAITGGVGGTGYSNGGNGGEQTSVSNSSGGGAGGGSTAVCVFGSAGTPCGTLLAVTDGGGGAGGGGCRGNAGAGGAGNAGASTGAAANSEPNGSAAGQGFGGGGGGSDTDKQAAGGGGGGGIGAAGGTAAVTATSGGTGAANNTAGSAGAVLSGGSGPAGTAGSASGAGAAGATNTSGTDHQGGGGGGGGYTGGGSGAGNNCTILPSLGAGAGGAGSSWVATSQLTSFSNGANPKFTAGGANAAGSTTVCGVHTSQGVSGASTGAGGTGTTSSGKASADAGCPGNVTLTWSALPGAPTGVTASGGTGQSTVSWTTPGDPGTSSITGYTVTATPTGAGSPVSQTFNSTATSETLTGLTNGVSYNLSVAAVSSVGTGPSANASNNPVTIGVAPSITSGTSTTFTEGVAGSFTVTSTGIPTPAVSESGALPSGVTFTDNGDGTASLAGTPAAGSNGVYPLTITCANGVSPNATQSFTLTVDGPPVITSAAATTFTEGSSGSFAVTTTGTPAPALSESGTLPSGVSFVDNGNGSGSLTGTPAVGSQGSYPITFGATNGLSPDASQSFTLTVDGPPAITSGDSTTFDEGSPGSFTVTSTGTPGAALSESGSLPSGVTFTDNGDGTATLSGTPAAGTSASYPLTITASNGVSPNATQSFTLTVDGPPAITSAASTTFTEGTSGTFAVTTSGLPDAALTESGSLPSGVTFTDNGDGTATLAGTPDVGTQGSYPITITASNGFSPDATQSFTLTVNGPPAITSASSTTFTEGTSGSFAVTSTGTPGAALSESGSLPSGVTFTDNGDGTATLAGTPAAGSNGIYPLTITASNGVSPNATQSFTLTVNGAPTITSGDSTLFSEGSSGSFTVTSTGTPAPALSESGSLPSGVTFSDNGDGTATLSGTPATGSNGIYPITIAASNGVSPDASQSFTLTVNGPPVFTSGTSATFTEGSVEDFTVTSTGTPTPTLSEHGHLPAGITFTDNGDGTADLAGTPAAGSHGVYSLTIQGVNGVNPNASQTFTLTVLAAPTFTSATSTTFNQNAAGSFTVTTTGDPVPNLIEFGTLPSGVTFRDNGNGTGTLSGTSGQRGTYQIFFGANNGVGGEVAQEFTLTIGGLEITTTSLPTLVEGTAYHQQLSAIGGVTPYKWKKTATLPQGLTLSSAGVLSGTVTSKVAPGTYTVHVSVSDAAPKTAKQTVTAALTLVIQAPPAFTSASSATFTEGSANSFTVTATGSPTPSVTEAGTLPTGVTFSGGVLSGTPTVAGSFPITFTASNGIGSTTQHFTLAIEGLRVTTTSLPALTEGTPYSQQLTAADGIGALKWTKGAALPKGLSLTSAGLLKGTVSVKNGTPGTYPIQVTVTDSTKHAASATINLTINS